MAGYYRNSYKYKLVNEEDHDSRAEAHLPIEGIGVFVLQPSSPHKTGHLWLVFTGQVCAKR
jgi:hypothetical protein